MQIILSSAIIKSNHGGRGAIAIRIIKNIAFFALASLAFIFVTVGYAAISGNLSVGGRISITPGALPDVYITDITPESSAGVTVDNTSATVMFASVSEGGVATFHVNVINVSNGVYVFDRVIDGAEMNIDGIYSGTDITYEINGISRLDEISPNGGRLSFDVTITVPEGVSADCYVLNFHFIDKYGIPSEDYFPEGIPDGEIGLIQKLSDILNNKYTSDIVKNSRDYLLNETIKVISWNGHPYVGSMDTVYDVQLHNLFGEILNDGAVSFILKHEDINWDGYKEVALYSTSDILDCTDEWAGNGVVCVYVTVFAPVIDENRNIVGYNMVCEALRGYCSEVRYSENELIPSFSTDTWLDDIGYWAWTEELGSYIEKVPDDAMSNYGALPFRQDFASYNLYYIYDFWRTAPYGNNIGQRLDGKIPYLQ